MSEIIPDKVSQKGGSGGASKRTSGTVAPDRSPSRHRGLLIGLAVLLVLILAGCLVLLLNAHKQEQAPDSSGQDESLQLSDGVHTLNYDNGDRYKGSLKDGVPNGEGTLYYSDGKRYEGAFAEGVPSGQGVLYYSDEEYYRGAFAEGVPNGQGVLYNTVNGRCEGTFSGFDLEGTGTIYFDNGTRYVGEVRREGGHGTGTIYYPDGVSYESQWKNGGRLLVPVSAAQEGTADRDITLALDHRPYTSSSVKTMNITFDTGESVELYTVIEYDNGDRYEGGAKDGLRNMHGDMSYHGGNIYRGLWLDDMFSGDGLYIWNDGSNYDGSWEKGLPNGHGIYTDSSGCFYEGDWENGQLDYHGVTIRIS